VGRTGPRPLLESRLVYLASIDDLLADPILFHLLARYVKRMGLNLRSCRACVIGSRRLLELFSMAERSQSSSHLIQSSPLIVIASKRRRILPE
jgi:hypothetical protein